MGTTNGLLSELGADPYNTTQQTSSVAAPPPLVSALGITPYNSNGQLTSNSNPNTLNNQLSSNYYTQVNAQQQSDTQQQQQIAANTENSISQAAKPALNLATQQTGIGNWLTTNVANPVNSFGNTAFGFAPPDGEGATGALGSGTIATPAETEAAFGEGSAGTGSAGISSADAAWTGTTLTEGLGDFGAAVVGNQLSSLAASAFGFQHNPGDAEVGATAGGLIGAFFGGPIGAGVGSFIGSTIGGLFGPPPSDMTQIGQINLSNGTVNPGGQANESSTGSSFNAGNQTLAVQSQAGASNLAQFLLANGATPIQNQQSQLLVKVGSRDGYQVGYVPPQGGTPQYTTTLPSGTDPSKLYNAVSQNVLAQYNIPPALQTQLTNTNLGAFYQPNFNPSSISQQNNSTTTPLNTTPTVAAQNNNGRGLLQIPTNTVSGQQNAQPTSTTAAAASSTAIANPSIPTGPNGSQPEPIGGIG